MAEWDRRVAYAPCGMASLFPLPLRERVRERGVNDATGFLASPRQNLS